jgi:hypothetical protein
MGLALARQAGSRRHCVLCRRLCASESGGKTLPFIAYAPRRFFLTDFADRSLM